MQPVCVSPCEAVVVERELDCRVRLIGVVHQDLLPHSGNNLFVHVAVPQIRGRFRVV